MGFLNMRGTCQSMFAVLAAAAMCTAHAKDPQWIFNHGPDAPRAIVSQGSALKALGLFRISVTGTDTTLSISYDRKDAFKALERPYFAMRYRITSKIRRCGIFFVTDTLTSLSDKSYSSFAIEPDGAWHNAIVDMRVQKPDRWNGTVYGFRIDPTNPSEPGDVNEISRIGFFPSREAAEAFLAEADDSEDYSDELVLSGLNYRLLAQGKSLSAGWRESDFRIRNEAPPAGEGALTVTCNGEPVPCYVNSKGFAFYLAERAGEYMFARVADVTKLRSLDPSSMATLGCGISAKAKPPSYFGRERIRIGGWGLRSSGVWNRKEVSDFAECGFDLLIANGRDSGADAGKLLSACDEDGVEVYLNLGVPADMSKMGLEFADHPSLCGYYLTDEPGTDAYGHWGEKAKTCREATGLRPFINLLPMYANAAQLKFGASAAAIEYYDPDPDLYRKYCEAYCDKVPTKYICTDIYPLHWIKGRAVTYRDYVESINVIASVARERNREFWCCIQTFGWCASKRTPNAAEFRWQCYSMLSFGCRAILCWVYVSRDASWPSLITCDGERTAAWYDARTVLNEVKAISDVFCSYRNLGAFTHNCTDATPYLKMTGEYRNFAAIRSVKCSAPLLFGCFESKSGKGTAFTVVNMSDLEKARSTLAKIDIAGENVTVYRRGVPARAERGADGMYDIPLEGGEGVFVTVE